MYLMSSRIQVNEEDKEGRWSDRHIYRGQHVREETADPATQELSIDHETYDSLTFITIFKCQLVRCIQQVNSSKRWTHTITSSTP